MKMSIFRKLLLSFLIIVILIGAQGFISFKSFTENERLKKEIIKANNLHSFLIQMEVEHHLWMIELYDMFAGGPIPEKVNSHQECNLGKWYYSYQPTDYNREYYAALEKPHKFLHNSSRLVVELYREGKTAEAISYFRSETVPAVEGIRVNLNKIEELEAKRVEALAAEMELLNRSIFTAVLLGTTFSLIIALSLAFLLTKNIVSPVRAIAATAEQVAGGDLTRHVHVKNRDELGSLADSFNVMINMLQNLVRNIKEKSQLVVESGTQLKSASAETGKTSTEVATSISQIAEGNGDISGQIQTLERISEEHNESSTTTLDNSSETLNVAKESEEAALCGQEAVHKAIEQLDAVTTTVNSAAQAIGKLRKKSAQIGEMVESIQGISAQTNLLALNAAIEAARAGEHGQGFAVVAEEVRKLAEESSQSASRITSLIEDIESETTVTVKSMDLNVAQVHEQVKVINEVGTALEKIVDLAENTRLKNQDTYEVAAKLKEDSVKISGIIQSIAAVVEESAAGAEEVAASTQEQSAAVEEVAASADQLQSMAEELGVLIEKFKISDEAGLRPSGQPS